MTVYRIVVEINSVLTYSNGSIDTWKVSGNSLVKDVNIKPKPMWASQADCQKQIP